MEKLFKVCTKCNKKLEANTDNFYKKIRGKYGLYAVCKKCQCIKKRNYYFKNHKQNKEKLIEYYNQNKDKYRKYEQTKIQNITDAYIINKCQSKNINKELLQSKVFLSVIREQIKIKRLIKQKQL